MARGCFITFEGGEGCGKSTQVALLERALAERGHNVLLVREPGGTPVGEKVRDILLSKGSAQLDPLAELMLYEAARAQIVAQVIRPALAAGAVVLCDRFYDSTVAYQGYGRGLDVEAIDRLNAMATGGLAPDVTLLLKLDPQVGLARAMGATGGDGTGDRIEAAGLAFHERVAAGFEAVAQVHPERVVVLDACAGIEALHEQVLACVAGHLPAL